MRRVLPVALALVAATACGATSPSSSPGSSPAADSGSSPSATQPSSQATSAWHPRQVTASTLSWRLPLPSSRQALIKVAGGRVLLAGGMLADGSSTADVRRIDLATGRTQRVPALAVPVHDAAGGPYAGSPAVYGGGNATEQSLVQALRQGRWTRVDGFATGRSDLSVVPVAAGTIVLGGYDGASVPLDVLSQQGDAKLRRSGHLHTGVRYAATAAVGRQVLVFGGEVSDQELSAVQRLDTGTGRTEVVAQLPRPLGHAMAVQVGDRVLLIGGRTAAHQQTDRLWWFDPAGLRFTPAGRLPRPLSDASVAVLGRSVYLLGGEQPGVTDRVLRLDVQ